MELTTLSDIALMTLLKEQSTILQQTQQNLEVINAEFNKRVEEHKKSKEPIKE